MRNWMIGLAGVAVVAVAAPAVAQVSWQWVTDRAERFTVELPGTAVKKDQPVDTDAGKLAAVSYDVDLGNGYYAAMSTTVPGSLTPEQVAGGLDSAIDGAVSAGGGTLTWKRTVTVSGQDAREAAYTLTSDGVAMRGHVLVTYRAERLYTVLAMEAATEPAGKAERMARSFKLLD